MRRTVVALWLVALVLGLALLPAWVGSPALARTVTELCVSLTLVVGLYLFIGNAGILSFGHLGFMAIGAYVAAWVSMDPLVKSSSLPALPDWLLDLQWPGGAAIAVGALAGLVVAAGAGAVLMRLRGVAASIASFAFLAIVYALASNWTDGTGGTASLIGVPGFATLPVTAAVAVVAIALAAAFDGSRTGLMLRAARDDEVAAAAVGIRAYRVRLVGFALSGALAAAAGSLHASYFGVVSPDAYFVDATFVALAMLVLGGMYSLQGAVLGTVFVTAAKLLLVALENGVALGSLQVQLPRGSQELAIAALICIVLVKRPRGLASGWRWGWRRRGLSPASVRPSSLHTS